MQKLIYFVMIWAFMLVDGAITYIICNDLGFSFAASAIIIPKKHKFINWVLEKLSWSLLGRWLSVDQIVKKLSFDVTILVQLKEKKKKKHPRPGTDPIFRLGRVSGHSKPTRPNIIPYYILKTLGKL